MSRTPMWLSRSIATKPLAIAHGDTDWVRDSVPKSLHLIEGMPKLRAVRQPRRRPCGLAIRGPDVNQSDGMSDVERAGRAPGDLPPQRQTGPRRRPEGLGYLRRVAHRRLRRDVDLRANPIVGGKAAAEALSVQLANVTTVHHCHTPVIDFQDRDNATGVWAMEDNLFWTRNGEKQWLRGFGFYHETYVRGDGRPMALQLSQTRTHTCRDVTRCFRHGGGFLGRESVRRRRIGRFDGTGHRREKPGHGSPVHGGDRRGAPRRATHLAA